MYYFELYLKGILPADYLDYVVFDCDLCPDCGEWCNLNGNAICDECLHRDTACPHCEGSGKIYFPRAFYNAEGLNYDEQDCPVCDGRGVFDPEHEALMDWYVDREYHATGGW